MSSNQAVEIDWLAQLELYLSNEGYYQGCRSHYPVEAKRFLDYLATRHISVMLATPRDELRYLRQERRRYYCRHGHVPRSPETWRSTHTSPIHLLLRLAQGQWPPAARPSTPIAVFHAQVCRAYGQWMSDFRGLAEETINGNQEEVQRFLAWLGEGNEEDRIAQLSPVVIDSYLKFRAATLSRRSRKTVATQLRSFLKYLHAAGHIHHDLADSVLAPKIYEFETLPSTFLPDEVRAVIDAARKDRSSKGLRDYAILMLLSVYGLRAGEVLHLRLEDIDWHNETLRISRSKTSVESVLPLLTPVGEAILAYLRASRPKTAAREVFIRMNAPYRSLRSLYPLVQTRLDLAGIAANGKRGPHAFRHARAVGLLRAGVVVKEIGDILGHRSAASTTIYLRLATEDLRAIALEIPEEGHAS